MTVNVSENTLRLTLVELEKKRERLAVEFAGILADIALIRTALNLGEAVGFQQYAYQPAVSAPEAVKGGDR